MRAGNRALNAKILDYPHKMGIFNVQLICPFLQELWSPTSKQIQKYPLLWQYYY